MKIQLKKWDFAIGETQDCLGTGREVSIPHTWNVEEGYEEHWGSGWYGCDLEIPKNWNGKRVWVRFEAAYHDAVVYLNGMEMGRHENSGYTPFTIELSGGVHYGGSNYLTVKVNNEFSETMLPYSRSFDWANDGGLIRGVSLFTTGEHRMESVVVKGKPILTETGSRIEHGKAELKMEVQIDGAAEPGLFLEWSLYRENGEHMEKICECLADCHAAASDDAQRSGEQDTAVGSRFIQNKLLNDVDYWHFDHPALYQIKLVLRQGMEVEDTAEITFGFRDFHIEGSRFILNGEPVRICGTEWMPGSNSQFGMAEPQEQLEKMLCCLKECNCVFTRFHWQQDEFVLDWCDRHGILVQEEIPFWGKEPKTAGEYQRAAFRQQIEEMYAAHGSHPSIISWGVGNELDAQAEETIHYIRDAIDIIHSMDETRCANYVSNTWIKREASDGVSHSDSIMLNDYIGTWFGEMDQEKEMQRILALNPDKPVVPSEFGLCEPAFLGGDKRREEIFLEKMASYRKHPEIAGSIYFCLNDYRTQMGEDGSGKLRKRIHGSTSLDGTPKPSYKAVQRECAPFILSWKEEKICITNRNDLPFYEMRGYRLKLLDQAGNDITEETIPSLQPGETWNCPCMGTVSAAIYRPTGDWAGTFQNI